MLHHWASAQMEVEPNGSQGQASSFASTGTIGGQSCNGDVDWLSTVVSGEGTLVATLYVENPGPSAGTVSLEVIRNNPFNPNAGTASQVIAAGANANVVVDSYCATAGAYFFRVVSNGSCANYTLSVEMQSGITANEIEPNDSYTTSNVLVEGDTARGRIRHLNAGLDIEDWWSIVIGDYGTLEVYWEVTNTGGSTAYYALSPSADGSLSGANSYPMSIPAGATMSQTYTFKCIHAANNWLRVWGNDGCGDYKLTYRVVSDPFTPTEVEPNNTYTQANLLAPGTTVQGHINYRSLNLVAQLDPQDWYRIDLTEHGALSVDLAATNTSPDPGYVYVLLHWGNGNPMWTYDGTVNLPGSGTSSGTFLFQCLTPGTYYIYLSAAECATYSLSWSIAGSPAPNNEVEPNDVFAQAQQVPYDQWTAGHVGENNFGFTDNDDWFRIDLPEDSVRVRVEYEATGLSTTAGGYLLVQAYRPDQSLAAQRYTGTGFNTTTTDSLVVNCNSSGTVYLRIRGMGCQAYRFRVVVEPLVPSVAFSTARFGQQVSFSPQVSGANSLLWNFGDLTTSTAQHPLKTYGFGNFNATLTATNTACNFSASASKLLVFTGLERFSPDRSGQGLVNMQVYGGGLTNATVVRLTGPGGTFTGSIASVNMANSVITAAFDLTAAPLGVYDVEVDIPGQGTVTVANGFTVEGLRYPECRVEVLGPSVFRVNRPQLFRLIVRNTGNVLAEGVVVGMAWPSGVVTVLGSQRLSPPSAGTTTLTVNGQTYTINNSDLAAFHAVDPVTPITQLNGEPFIGAARSFVLPQVPAGGFVEIPFTVTGTFAGPVRIMGYAHPLNMYHLGQLAPPWQNMIECYAYELAAVFQGVPHEEAVRAAQIAAQQARASAGQHNEQAINAQNQVGYTQDGVAASYAEDFAGMLEAAARVGAANGGPGLQQQLGNMSNTEQEQLSKDRVDAMQRIINENAQVQQQRVFPPSSPWFGDESIGQTNLERLNQLFGPEQDLQTQQELTEKTEDELDNAPVDLPIEMEDDLIRRITRTLWKQDDAPPLFLAGSFDPNAIHGPVGVGSEGFLSREDLQTFTILYENVDSATAAAQEVFVETQLDLTRFDPSSFSFGGVVIGGRHFNVPPGRQEFAFEAQMEPTDPYKVRVNATFDPATGLARWEFITLDLVTNNLPVLDGFLPPNVNSPEGEGSVLYSVRPWSTLPSNTTIQSTASIVFDLNEAIITNTWSNTTDDQAPTSFASASVQVENITVELTGTDDASGIAYYEIFVSTNGGAWQLLAASTQPTAQLIGEVGSTYAFYSQAVDSVGNREVKAPIAEATVILTGIPEQMAEPLFFNTHPNPTDGALTITAMRPIHGAQLLVTDARGRVVLERSLSLDAGSSRTIDLTALGAGTYMLSVRSAGGAFGAKRVVVVK
jgi:hypothetical protein